MFSPQSRLWWPIALDEEQVSEVQAFEESLHTKRQELNLSLNSTASVKLALQVVKDQERLLLSDSLPTIAHLLVGWGNVKFIGLDALDLIGAFIHRREHGGVGLLQCNPEGEVHPWQTFAYACMAGVNTSSLIEGISIRELLHGSFDLGTSDSSEYGHALFAMVNTGVHEHTQSGMPSLTIHEIAKQVIHAHFMGSFHVCRKFHLTEGFCAYAALVSASEKDKALAQTLLNSQLDILLILAAIVNLSTSRTGDEYMIASLRDSLCLGNLLENHLFYAGHLLELAAFASMLGYRISTTHCLAINYIANAFNSRIDSILRRLDFLQCLYQFAHYRRGITLAPYIATPSSAPNLDPSILSEFTVNCSANQCMIESPLTECSFQEINVSGPGLKTHPKIQEIAELFNGLYKNMKAVGKHPHFRRILIKSWPRSMHYEFLLANANKIGVEIHFECPLVMPLAKLINHEILEQEFIGHHISRHEVLGRFIRFRILMANSISSADIIKKMMTLIKLTRPCLDPVANSIRI
jgi:hypothetical protein